MRRFHIGLLSVIYTTLVIVESHSALQKRVFFDTYCRDPPSPGNGVVVSCDASSFHPVGAKCTIRCSHGYELEQGGTSGTIECVTGAHWSNSSKCINPNFCGQPPVVQNGTYVCTSTTHNTGSSCQLYCSKRHQLSGNENIFCTNRGSWSAPGACIESQCPEPPKIQVGNYICPAKSYPHGTSCYLQCDGGYRPVSNNINITCRQDETWTPSTSCLEGCLPGTYSKRSPSGEQYCEGCPKGTFQPKVDTTSCISCPPGWSTVLTASTDINSCRSMCHPGTFSSSGVEPCHLCLQGTYQNATGGLTCLDCPPGLTTQSVASTSLTQCISV